MATTVRELLVKLGIKADQQALTKFDKGLGQIKQGMGQLVKVAAITAVAVTAVTAAIIGNTIAVAAQGDELAKTADRLDVTTDFLQKYRFAADRSGVSTEEFTVGLRRLSKTMLEASKGTGLAFDAFDAFGVKVTDVDGDLKNQEQILLELSEAYVKMGKGVKRGALLQDIFGRSGQALGPLLAQGASGIKELTDRAVELGVVMSEDDARASEKFVDAMLDAKVAAGGLRREIGLALLPALTKLVDGFNEWFVANREVIDQNMTAILVTIGAAASAALIGFFSVGSVIALTTVLAGLFTVVSAIATMLGVTLGPALAVLAAVMVGITFTVAQLVVGLLVFAAGLFAVFLAAEDLYTFLNGGDSILGRLLERLGLSEEAFAALSKAINAGKTLFSAFLGVGLAIGRMFIAVLTPAFNGLMLIATPLFKILGDLLGKLVGKEIQKLSDFADGINTISNAIGKLTDFLNNLTTAGKSGILSSLLSSLGLFGDLINLANLADAVSKSAGSDVANTTANTNTTSNNMNQTNTINVEGSGDPAAVGQSVVDQLGAFINQTAGAFSGGVV